jgi:glycine betaine/proline transport system substrate-binding protein
MRFKKLGLVVAPMAALALLAGCSGDDGSDGGASGDQPGAGVEVTAARANWSTGFFQAEVFRQLLGELGYEVSDPADAELGPDIFYPALAQGEYDYWANGWIPLHTPNFEAQTPTGDTVGELVSPVGFEVEKGALQGYLIDKKTADEYGITSLAQIVEDPELGSLFDENGDGTPDLYGCNEGWGCARAINATIELNGWQDSLTHKQGEYSVLFQDVKARIARSEPALFYTWTPNFTIAQLPVGEAVVWIGLGGTAPEGEDTATELEPGLCAADPCDMGFAPADIRVVANNEFLTENPAAEALFESVQIPVEDIAAQNLEYNDGADTPQDITDQASSWVEANREQVDEWLEAARAAA